MRRLLSILMIIGLLGFAGLAFAEDQAQPLSPTLVEQPATAPAPLKIDTGDTAWMIVATAFVMLMTIPGLALFYGGLSKRKDTLNTIAMSFVTFCIVSVLWVVYGYTFAFGTDISGIIGSPAKILLAGVGVNSIADAAKTIPEYIFIVYQLTFAAITVALASGAYIERMKFSAWVLFSILWMTLAYLPIAHWVWGGGFLARLGALDFAGGTVVHINAGIAALVGALILGKRREMTLIPNNLTLVVTGAGLLWFGWFGFNAGSALAANGLAGAAFINTNTATAVAAVAWMLTEWMHSKKPTVLGLASGAVAGLVAITPAAGFVNITGALIIGIAAGVVSFLSVAVIKPKLGYDDTLDAFGIHGVAGTLGAILTGVFADPSINEAGKGLLYGNPGQLWTQIIAAGVTIVYTAVVTVIIFMIIKVFIGLRVDVEEEIEGLDESQHGEKAYNL
ncbi:ammonium transporter [Dissulfurispira thermophila]|uniref:Ammonium transporter n=1 Tax=Dissulfurispira thermophila TaxID=2715679 RepID=A0A7G1GZM7_9BACT|nr:ammonium transporter [Dissulfurispira thermophila]BCB95346.1 ammonium transporter [Dissulfurispira thermophila]